MDLTHKLQCLVFVGLRNPLVNIKLWDGDRNLRYHVVKEIQKEKKHEFFFLQKLHTRTFNCECAAIRQLLNTSTIRTTSCVACEAMNNTLGRRTTMSQQSAALENFCT